MFQSSASQHEFFSTDSENYESKDKMSNNFYKREFIFTKSALNLKSTYMHHYDSLEMLLKPKGTITVYFQDKKEFKR